MNKEMKWLIYMAVLLLPIAGWAADQDGYYRPYSMVGKHSDYTTCKGFIVAQNSARNGHFDAQNQFNQWLDGYLTAYDAYNPDTFDIAYGKSLESLDLRLERYCEKHPNNLFSDAVDTLMFELFPTRARTNPRK